MVPSGLHVPRALGSDTTVEEGAEEGDLDEEEEEEVEVEREWVESGVFGDGAGVPDGEPLPADAESLQPEPRAGSDAGSDAGNDAGSERFIRAGITDFVREGLGMGQGWAGDRCGSCGTHPRQVCCGNIHGEAPPSRESDPPLKKKARRIQKLRVCPGAASFSWLFGL